MVWECEIGIGVGVGGRMVVGLADLQFEFRASVQDLTGGKMKMHA
jgi:hypothetical protein